MKTTKTIEIEICDKCGTETRPYTCSQCKVECCDRCAETVHISVNWYHPNPVSKYGTPSTNVRPVLDKYFTHLCQSCSNKLLLTLQIGNFTKDTDVRTYVVED